MWEPPRPSLDIWTVGLRGVAEAMLRHNFLYNQLLGQCLSEISGKMCLCALCIYNPKLTSIVTIDIKMHCIA
jgi:hypothetical protein